MINRSELVTAALLGTDRRAPNFLGEPGEHEPATLLLDHAARSAVALRAGVVLPQVPPAPSGPLDELIMAPTAAQSIMSRLLARPVIELVNFWLAVGRDARSRTRAATLVGGDLAGGSPSPISTGSCSPGSSVLAGCGSANRTRSGSGWRRHCARAHGAPPALPPTLQPVAAPDELEQDPELDPIAQLRLEIQQAFADHDHQEPLS